jgi:peroxiredoxin
MFGETTWRGSMSWKFSSLAGVAIAAIVAAVALDGRAAEGFYKVGDKVESAAKLKDVAGKETGLESLKGKVVFLNFFSLRWGGCNAEAPHLEKDIWQGYKDKGLVVVGVSRDADGGKKFKQRHSLTYDIWVDEEGKLFEKFVDTYIPWNAVIDKDGTVKYTKVGYEAEELKKLLDELLKK